MRPEYSASFFCRSSRAVSRAVNLALVDSSMNGWQFAVVDFRYWIDTSAAAVTKEKKRPSWLTVFLASPFWSASPTLLLPILKILPGSHRHSPLPQRVTNTSF